MNNPYASPLSSPVAERDIDVRADFLAKTYTHLMGAITAFALIEIWLFKSGLIETIAPKMLSQSWLLILGAFMIVGTLASRAAHRAQTKPVQYAALGGYILAQALIFAPMLFLANDYAPGAINSAAQVTLGGFGALTALVFITKKDFSFLRTILFWVGICAVGAIVAGVIFGFQLGTWFSVAMVAFAGASILHTTSQVLFHYPEGRHVSAALELFASVAMMFWYVLRIFMSRD